MNDGILDFFSGLPKAIYSFIATLITTNLLKMLSNSQSEFEDRKSSNSAALTSSSVNNPFALLYRKINGLSIRQPQFLGRLYRKHRIFMLDKMYNIWYNFLRIA